MKRYLIPVVLSAGASGLGILWAASASTGPSAPRVAAPVPHFGGEYQSREFIDHGVKLEMLVPGLAAGDDAATLRASNYVPHDPRFEYLIPIASAVALIGDVAMPMMQPVGAPPGAPFELHLPTGWSAGVKSVRIRTFDANGNLIFGGGMDNIVLP